MGKWRIVRFVQFYATLWMTRLGCIFLNLCLTLVDYYSSLQLLFNILRFGYYE
jgi:hypothetical protein